MQHSINEIANRYSRISKKRGDNPLFIADDFINFAKVNKKIYSLIDNGNDMLVSTWYSNDLINDYKKSRK